MTTDARSVRHGDHLTLAEIGPDGPTTTTYLFVDHYRAADDFDDDCGGGSPADRTTAHEIITSGTAIGQQLRNAQIGFTLTVSHLDRTSEVRVVALHHDLKALR